VTAPHTYYTPALQGGWLRETQAKDSLFITSSRKHPTDVIHTHLCPHKSTDKKKIQTKKYQKQFYSKDQSKPEPTIIHPHA
jgi:hypothetical protein